MLIQYIHTPFCFKFTPNLVYNLLHPLPYHTQDHKSFTESLCIPHSTRLQLIDPYTHTEWDTALTLLRLKATATNHTTTENFPKPTPEAPKATTISTSMRADTDYSLKPTACAEDPCIIAPTKTHRSDTLTSAPQHRLTRSMGTKTTLTVAYDMSYHPLDDVIGTHARRRSRRVDGSHIP